jgi:hypothetical protein
LIEGENLSVIVSTAYVDEAARAPMSSSSIAAALPIVAKSSAIEKGDL